MKTIYTISHSPNLGWEVWKISKYDSGHIAWHHVWDGSTKVICTCKTEKDAEEVANALAVQADYVKGELAHAETLVSLPGMPDGSSLMRRLAIRLRQTQRNNR